MKKKKLPILKSITVGSEGILLHYEKNENKEISFDVIRKHIANSTNFHLADDLFEHMVLVDGILTFPRLKTHIKLETYIYDLSPSFVYTNSTTLNTRIELNEEEE